MKAIKPLLMATTLAVLPLSSFAEGPSYSYIEGGYLKATQENGSADDFDFDGFAAAGSSKLGKNLYLFGDYRHLQSDTVANTRLQTDTGRIGLGFILPLHERVNLTAGGGAAYAKYNYEGSGAGLTPDDSDDIGYFVQTIARVQVLPALELNGGYRYEKVEKSLDDSESTGLVGAAFHFTPAFAAVGNYEFGDDTNRYILGARFDFGL